MNNATKHVVSLTVNGRTFPLELRHGATLLDAIRNDVGLTGTKQGCDDCECGACMVLVDGQPVNSCSYLAAQAQDREVTTVEGLVTDGELHAIQKNLLEAGGVQCGFCTPGMIMSTHALLSTTPDPTDEDIRIGLSGNLCRCTGYGRIMEAVRATAVELRSS